MKRTLTDILDSFMQPVADLNEFIAGTQDEMEENRNTRLRLDDEYDQMNAERRHAEKVQKNFSKLLGL